MRETFFKMEMFKDELRTGRDLELTIYRPSIVCLSPGSNQIVVNVKANQ